ncbi:MAG TPA: hypothetical protein O0W91_02685 [Methanocorpusculum sp.]|nr:hypothetical protein [Methanocorpusculum sp.]HJK02153.1 hypothetical protein [Methanocorpusculum sp.]
MIRNAEPKLFSVANLTRAKEDTILIDKGNKQKKKWNIHTDSVMAVTVVWTSIMAIGSNCITLAMMNKTLIDTIQ